MMPIKIIETFMLDNKLALKKKQPMGTPALPMAAIVAMMAQLMIVGGERAMP